MVSAILSVLGVFIGILICAVIVGVGLFSGAYKLLKKIVLAIIGLFKKDK